MSLLIWTLLLYFPYSIVFWSMVTLENYTVKGSAPHCHSALLDSISSRHLNKNGSRVDWILNVLCLHIIWRQYLKWYLSVQFSSPAQSCPTLCNPMNRSNETESAFQQDLKLFLVAQMVKNLPAMKEAWVQSLGQKNLLEKGMATHSSIPAWRIPWTEEPGGLQSNGVTKSWIRLSDWHFNFQFFQAE